MVGGTLRLNERGCFEVGGYLLLAPHGSAVSTDPLGITIPGKGFIPVGGAVSGGGGYADDEELSEGYQAMATPRTKGVVLLNPEAPQRP
ncbi:hypothetical protein [Nocardioides aequoreus]|uniref:hypothetical protein n=1 Tax=Nocardioides aequoreus TaxID=397278 RepID=UPI0004C2D109|nr:hypothetical protein [Nocardioides aequoreus]